MLWYTYSIKHTNTKHMSLNKDDYQFKCKMDQKVFWNSWDLVKHLNDHVVQGNIKITECHDEPIRCKICGTFTLVNDDDIRKHVIKHMVRNHQDGYPYIILALFFFLKIYKNIIFFGKNDWSMNSGPRWAGDC